MDAQQLYREGKLDEAIAAVGESLRGDPSNLGLRTFLFDLLCFAGSYERAQKHLHAIAASDPELLATTLGYGQSLTGTEERRELFGSGGPPTAGPDQPIVGTLNGEPFGDLVDADARVGRRLELLVQGRYMCVAFHDVRTVETDPPEKLRDLFWLPARVQLTAELGGNTLDSLIPVVSPEAADHPDDLVRLGRKTVWGEEEDSVPVGRKLWLVDREEIEILEVRELRIEPVESPAEEA